MDRRPTTPRGWPARAKRCGRESSPSRARRSMAPAISVRVQTHVTTWSSSDSHPRTRSLSVSATIRGEAALRRGSRVPRFRGDATRPCGWRVPRFRGEAALRRGSRVPRFRGDAARPCGWRVPRFRGEAALRRGSSVLRLRGDAARRRGWRVPRFRGEAALRRGSSVLRFRGDAARRRGWRVPRFRGDATRRGRCRSHVSAETPSSADDRLPEDSTAIPAPPVDVTAGSHASAETSSRPPGVEGRAEASGSAAAADSPFQGSGQAALEDADGLRVSTETARRMACDAAKVVMRHAADGSVLDVGRKTRTVPPALRRALQARDRRCRFLPRLPRPTMFITSSPGPTAVRHGSTTSCCSAGGTTGRSTRRASRFDWVRRAMPSSAGPTAGRSRTRRRRRPGPARRWRRPTRTWPRPRSPSAPTPRRRTGTESGSIWATPSASCGCRAAAAPVRMQPARSRTEGQRSIWSCQLHRDAGERRRPVTFLRSPWPASATCGRRSDSEVARFAAQLHTVVHLACWSASSTALVAGWGRRRRRRLRR